MTLTDRSKKVGVWALWLGLAIILLILSMNPKVKELTQKWGVPTVVWSWIQTVAIVAILIITAILLFMLAPLFAGILGVLMSIFAVALILAAVAYIYTKVTKRINVRDPNRDPENPGFDQNQATGDQAASNPNAYSEA